MCLLSGHPYPLPGPSPAPLPDPAPAPLTGPAPTPLPDPTDPCPSPAVVRGAIQDVTHAPERQESAIHLRVSHVYRQKGRVFRAMPGGGWRGHVATLLACGVRPGRGEFLFTGHLRFGEAQLGCAPRLEDFRRVYRDAEARGLNPCEMPME